MTSLIYSTSPDVLQGVAENQMPTPELRGSTGRPLSGAAAVSAAQKAAERAAEAECWEHTRALARYLIARDGLEGIADGAGRTDARRIAALAGQGTHRLLGIWAEEDARAEAAREHQALRHRLGYEQDPRHDPRVTAAIVAGRPAEEINALIEQVNREYAERPPVGVIGPPGNSSYVSASEMEADVPVQKSVILSDWDHCPDDGGTFQAGPSVGVAAEARLSLPASAEPARTVAAASADAPQRGCEHYEQRADAKYCGDCGAPMNPQAAASAPPISPLDPRSAS